MKQTKLNFFKNKPSLDTPLTTPNSRPAYKSRPMKPLLSTQLVTSTPDSHQISKRIKGLLRYSEHYKGNRIDYPVIGPCFSPLQARDYRKARELTLEIWDPMIQISFLEKFLRGLKNLQILRIEVLTKKYHKGEILKRLCGILSKNSGLTRVHIDFVEDQRKQVLPGLSKRVRFIRKLPKLKDLDVTVGGEQVTPFPLGLRKVGFGDEGGFDVEDTSTIQNLMQRTPKVYQLDTIRIESRGFHVLPHNLWDGLAFLISKLPKFRELDFTFSKKLYLPLEQIFHLLDALLKAPKFKIFKTGFQIKDIDQISFLEHPLFQAKSLKRTHLSLFLQEITPKELKRISELLQGISSLYELSLIFSPYIELNDETVEDFMRKISEVTSIRKLNIVFDKDSKNLSEKQAGSIVQWIFNKMVFLEELGLRLPRYCHDLGCPGGKHFQGLPRLKKAWIQMIGWNARKEEDLKTLIEGLGKCHQLRELNLDLQRGKYDHQMMTTNLIKSLKKLKELQVFGLYAPTDSNVRNMKTKASVLESLVASLRNSGETLDFLLELVRNFDGMRNLQDFTVDFDLSELNGYNREKYDDLLWDLKRNQKYRCTVPGDYGNEEQDDEEQDDEDQEDEQQHNDEEQEDEDHYFDRVNL